MPSICVGDFSDGAGHASAAVRTVLRNVVQITKPYDRRARLASQDATPDGHIASECALLVCIACLRSQHTDIGSIDGVRGCSEAEPDILIPPPLL